MKLLDITPKKLKGISNQELISLHNRVHQLYGVGKKKKLSNDFLSMLKRVHTMLVDEILKRNLNHNSPLLEELDFLENYLRKIG